MEPSVVSNAVEQFLTEIRRELLHAGQFDESFNTRQFPDQPLQVLRLRRQLAGRRSRPFPALAKPVLLRFGWTQG
jgi:hypothetical protein